MGGYGSGRWYRFVSKRDTVEGQHSVDVRWLGRHNYFPRDGSIRAGTLRWSRGDRETGSIGVVAWPDRLELSYRHRAGGDWQDVRETVRLTYTACNYGGQRPWFVCPAVGCGRRVAVLYGAGRYFLCRHCYGLAYESQSEDMAGRLRDKAQRIRRRLGGSASLIEPFPRKPWGMHWRTYERLQEEAELAGLASLVLAVEDMQRMVGWVDRLGKR